MAEKKLVFQGTAWIAAQSKQQPSRRVRTHRHRKNQANRRQCETQQGPPHVATRDSDLGFPVDLPTTQVKKRAGSCQ